VSHLFQSLAGQCWLFLIEKKNGGKLLGFYMVSCLQELGYTYWVAGYSSSTPTPFWWSRERLEGGRGDKRKVATGNPPHPHSFIHSFGHQFPQFYVPLYALPTSHFGHETLHSFRKWSNIHEFTEKVHGRGWATRGVGINLKHWQSPFKQNVPCTRRTTSKKNFSSVSCYPCINA